MLLNASSFVVLSYTVPLKLFFCWDVLEIRHYRGDGRMVSSPPCPSCGVLDLLFLTSPPLTHHQAWEKNNWNSIGAAEPLLPSVPGAGGMSGALHKKRKEKSGFAEPPSHTSGSHPHQPPGTKCVSTSNLWEFNIIVMRLEEGRKSWLEPKYRLGRVSGMECMDAGLC